MSEVPAYLWLVPALPLLGAAVSAFLGPRVLRNKSHWPCVVGLASAFVVSVMVFLEVYDVPKGTAPLAEVPYYTWVDTGGMSVSVALRADPLSAMMCVMVTFIGTLIAVYAIGYMHGEKDYARFFAAVALFGFSMLMLVLGDNLVMLFLGWEGVGLCSYLLIGFWYNKPSAADAARKAFLVTRIGDVGLFLGLLLLWHQFGTLDYGPLFAKIEGYARDNPADTGLLTGAALLLFCGAVGKSAQFPLHVWLPDAMEGPTPVSALIHAATMVTAGVYLVARFTVLFVHAPTAQLVVGVIGGITTILAALIALTQNDLKRVLAYSTLSQLGYMFMALGCAVGVPGGGTWPLATFAVVAAMFHLLTHAFFKALLFLSAGSVMTAMGHVIDMRRFSGLRQVMPTTHWTFLCGALALSGFPLLSGFWSKDEILAAALDASKTGLHGQTYLLLLGIGLVTAFLTAFYTFRAYFKTFWGPLKVPEEADAHHGHGHEEHADHGHGRKAKAHHGPRVLRDSYESPAVMTVPLVVLAVFAVGVGLALGPTHLFAHFLERTPSWPHEESTPAIHWELMGLSSVLAVAGIGLAWLFYVRRPEWPAEWAKAAPALYQLSLNKFYLDELYLLLFVRPAEALAGLSRRFDQGGVDGVVDLVGTAPKHVGGLFRPVQNGLVQFYALAMVLGLTVFLLALVRSL
jgi:NADH-quinone oxidoreductase subunit L